MANENNVASIDVAQESADGHRAIPRRGRDGLPGRTATPTLRNHDQGAAPFIGLAAGARGNRSGHGVHSAILEAGVEGVGTVPAFIPGASLFQPCSQGAEAGLPRRRAVAAAVPGGGVDLELCPGARAAELGHDEADEDPPGAHRVRLYSLVGTSWRRCGSSFPGCSAICSGPAGCVFSTPWSRARPTPGSWRRWATTG